MLKGYRIDFCTGGAPADVAGLDGCRCFGLVGGGLERKMPDVFVSAHVLERLEGGPGPVTDARYRVRLEGRVRWYDYEGVAAGFAGPNSERAFVGSRAEVFATSGAVDVDALARVLVGAARRFVANVEGVLEKLGPVGRAAEFELFDRATLTDALVDASRVLGF
jgi:hypothetical protein